MKGVKRFKLPSTKQVIHGDVIYSMTTIVNKIVLYAKSRSSKVSQEKILLLCMMINVDLL